MKKLSLILFFALFLVLVNCSEDSNTINQPVKEEVFISKTSIHLVIAAHNNKPDMMFEPITIGILDRGKTEIFANVVYIDPEKKVYYQFEKNGDEWSRNNYERIKYHQEYSLSKTTVNSSEVAELFSAEDCNSNNSLGNQLILENIQTYDEDGEYTTSLYYDNIVKSANFIDPSEFTSGNISYDIGWNGKSLFRCWYDTETANVFSDATTNSTKNGNEYAEQISATVHVNITVPLPPAPILTSPSSGSTEERSVAFSWNAVTGYIVDKYWIEVFDVEDQVNVHAEYVTGTSKTYDDFEYSKTYVWKVKAHNLTGNGSFSTSRTFTVQNPPALSITISSIGNNQYSASASGGSGTYTSYEWWYRNDISTPPERKGGRAPNPGVWIKNSQWDDQTTVTFNPSYDNFSLKCKVTDSNDQTAEDIYSEGF